MSKKPLDEKYRYVSDLQRLDAHQKQTRLFLSKLFPFFIALIFLVIVGVYGGLSLEVADENLIMLVSAAIIGGYMALNIGANDVANNMGPAVGGRVLTVMSAVLIAAVCESAGAILAGGDVVKTVAKGIISPGDGLSITDFRNLMLCALLAAALWVNLATFLNAPVSTTHSIVGLVAASLLFFIQLKVFNVANRVKAAKKWVPILIGLMAGAFAAYMALKGLKKIWKPSSIEIVAYSALSFLVFWIISVPYISKVSSTLTNEKRDINSLFNLPLIAGVALLSFAHGANDVANAIGPLAAIVSTFSQETVAAKVGIPIWVLVIGAVGLALGLLLFGPKLIHTVGDKITRLNAPRAYCVALASAVTVLIATTLGLPVSSTHIAIGAIFGVGFLREVLENPNKRRLKPGHKLNQTSADAFSNVNVRLKRKLVRRNFVLSIAAAWVITVPASAFIAGALFFVLSALV